MREVPAIMSAAWNGGEFLGNLRPIARVTAQRSRIRHFYTSDNLFTSILFGPPDAKINRPRELHTVKSVSWQRSIDTDAATCTVVLHNLRDAPYDDSQIDLDRPGYYGPMHGRAPHSGRWDHKPNIHNYLLMPDNILRTYEGYGTIDVPPGTSYRGVTEDYPTPENDPNLVLTGVWIIDDIEMTSDGLMTINCRDLSRLLHEHLAFPPVVPLRAGPKTKTFPHGQYAYPLSFNAVEQYETNVSTSRDEVAISWDDDSNTPWVGKGTPVEGHVGRDAFDERTASYWLSIGNARGDQGYSYEWVQGSIKKQAVNEVRFRTRGKGYTAYLCLYADGAWQGTGTVPYDPNHPAGFPNGSDTRYVKAVPVTSEDEHVIRLDTPVKNVTKVRIALGLLWDSGIEPYRYRAGMRTFRVFSQSVTRERESLGAANYKDYTDIIKLLCAWAGFYWPRDARFRWSDKNTYQANFIKDDPFLGVGRVWGDLEKAGTFGPASIPPEVFDKKPLIDGITYIRDILGFMFHVDETGAAVFRHPNIFELGNLWRTGASRSGNRTRRMINIDEKRSLLDLSMTLSSRNVRERVFVASTNGKVGGMAQGWNPNPRGWRRVSGWTDQHFETNEECQVMADMVALRQLFAYRTDRIAIAGYPAIQIDDQVRIFERITSEGYIHYVKGITSNLDMETGEWIYDLETHWLGERPFRQWAFDRAKLSRETQRWLDQLYGG